MVPLGLGMDMGIVMAGADDVVAGSEKKKLGVALGCNERGRVWRRLVLRRCWPEDECTNVAPCCDKPGLESFSSSSTLLLLPPLLLLLPAYLCWC